MSLQRKQFAAGVSGEKLRDYAADLARTLAGVPATLVDPFEPERPRPRLTIAEYEELHNERPDIDERREREGGHGNA